MRHMIDPLDFTKEEVDRLLALADDIAADPSRYREVCRYKKLATLFYEPSTRTRLSFEAAMLNLGGSVLGFSSADSSSASKGESIADTIRVISCYADICAMRHPKEGAPLRASMYSRIPVINAGDGGHQHPTQTLTDMMTIRRRLGRLENLTIGLCGDLKFGRTVHSLIKSLSRYTNIRFILISPEELRVPDYVIREVLEPKNIPFEEVSSLEDVMPQLGLFYILLAYFVIVGTGNAVNLTDGLDGLAIMPTVFVAGGFALVAWATGNMNFASYLHIPYLRHAGELVIVCTAIVGAGLGFLWFNTYPAQVFMGDVGSLALGGALGIIAVLLRQEFLLVIMGGVFVVETLSVILQVGSFKLRGQRIFRMAPIHHHYELKGWPEPRVIVRFWIISLMLVLIGLATLKVR